LNRLKIHKTEKQLRQEQRQTRIAKLADKKAKDKLTLEDIDEKLDIILEILQDRKPLE
jgi:hypothetical protein